MKVVALLALFLAGSSAAVAQQDTVPRAQVYGAVRDARTGATVYCTVEHFDKDGKRQALTTVNSDGRYSFFVPAAEPFLLRVAEENGYAPLERTIEAISKGSAPLRIDLVLHPE